MFETQTIEMLGLRQGRKRETSSGRAKAEAF